MARERTTNMNDYIDDYEAAARDYAEMGPLWAEMVFPDDFETLKAIYGSADKAKNHNNYRTEDYDKSRSRHR